MSVSDDRRQEQIDKLRLCSQLPDSTTPVALHEVFGERVHVVLGMLFVLQGVRFRRCLSGTDRPRSRKGVADRKPLRIPLAGPDRVRRVALSRAAGSPCHRGPRRTAPTKRSALPAAEDQRIGVRGSNLTFESGLGFRGDSRRASLADANRHFPFCHICR